jgi:hypothetical protein
MEEIYRSSPDPLVRGANLVFALVLILLIFISTQVTFTNTVYVKVTLTNSNEFTIGSTTDNVLPGQSAVITVASYPPEQYGYLKGRVDKSTDGSMIIRLDDAASSREIPRAEGLQGNAEVVVGEESLLMRLGKILF